MIQHHQTRRRSVKAAFAAWAAFITMVFVIVGFVRDFNKPAPTVTNNTIIQSDSIQTLKSALVRSDAEKAAAVGERAMWQNVAEVRLQTIQSLTVPLNRVTDSVARTMGEVINRVERNAQGLKDREASSRAMYSDLKDSLTKALSQVQELSGKVEPDTVLMPVVVEAPTHPMRVQDSTRPKRTGFLSRLFNWQ